MRRSGLSEVADKARSGPRMEPVSLLLRLIRLACLGLVLAASGARACEVTARWNDDPPYSMRGPGGALTGLNVELVEQTLARLGCKPRWVELPWARALVELEAGRLDLLAGALRRPEREAYAYFVARHSLSQNRLFVRRADHARVGTATSLTEALWPGQRLGVQIAVSYGPEYVHLLEKPEFRSRLTQSTSRRSLWQMLDLGRVDGVLASDASARYELVQMGLDQRIVGTQVVLSNEPAYVMISKRSRDAAWARRYEEASAAMQADGTMARIVKRYFDE